MLKTRFILAAVALAATSPALAQTVVAPPAAVVDELDLPAEREVIIREYVTREAPAPIIIEGGTVRPGSIVPDYVELRRFGNLADRSLSRYAYFASPDQKIVLVDPVDRRVVRILDR
ncbi:MAG TPA: DUF1236 domain-containing protein [Beijerinckiaceae bacterium]